MAADQDWPTAKAAGLAYIDQEIDTTLIYFYRVSVSDSLKDIHIEPGGSILNNYEQLTLPTPELELMNEGDHQVSLSWNTRYLSSFYTTYSVERSEDGKNFYSVNPSFINVNNNDIKSTERITYIDSLPENNQVYYYRIKGKTPFGSYGPFSNTIEAIGKDKISEVAVISKALAIDNKVLIEWDFPDSLVNKIAGFKVARSNNSEDSYIELNEELIIDQYTFTDSNPENTNYYIVNTYINDSTFSSSLPVLVQMEDSIPPKPPTGLTGTIDSLGVVSIEWDNNEEKDFRLSIQFLHHCNEVKWRRKYRLSSEPFQKAFFSDTIPMNNLTKEIYYSVVALDNRFNISEYSKALKLIKIDTIPPPAPVIKHYNYMENQIRLNWLKSTSSDLKGYRFTMCYKNDVQNDTLIDKNINSIGLDKSVVKVIIAAEDQFGNLSKTEEISFESVPELVTNDELLIYEIDRDNNEINLSWPNLPVSAEVFLYKKVNEESWRMLKRVISSNNYSDKNLAINNTYFYRIESLSGEGDFVKSEPLEINF